MDAKEVKMLLKQAREAIRDKDFKSALKYCKTVLKLDKNNYHAWVFIGAAAEEMGELEQTLAAFNKAIDISPDQVLAWQGLCNFYEKHYNDDNRKALENVYKKLKELMNNDKAKNMEILQKLYNLYKIQEDFLSALNVLLEQVQLCDENPKLEMTTWISITDMLQEDVGGIDVDDLMKKAYEHISKLLNCVSDDSDFNLDDICRKYLIFLKSKKDSTNAAMEAKRLSKEFPQLSAPVEYFCEFLLEKYVTDKVISDDIVPSLQELQDKNPESGSTSLLYGLYLYLFEKNCIEALDAVKKGLYYFPNNIIAWILFTEIQLAIHDYYGSEKSSLQALQLYNSSKVAISSTLVGKMYLHLGIALFGQQLYEKGLQAFSKAESKIGRTEDLLYWLCITALEKNDLSQAKHLRDELQKLAGESLKTNQTCILISLNEEKPKEALEQLLKVVKMEENDSYTFHLLGLSLWKTKNMDQAKISFLKAAKLDPFFYKNFLYLGHYYKSIGDFEKALQCYNKSFDLNKRNDIVGAAFSDILFECGETDLNLKLLKKITSTAPVGSAKWAWLRLGLHQLRVGETMASVLSLQNALKADSSDIHCWECLGDAYLQRGSFNAALKAFTKASELQPNQLYPQYQKANIKQLLGSYKEAIEEYQCILKLEPGYVPVLKGLTEAHLQQARLHFSKSLFGLALDSCNEALQTISTAVLSRPNFSCLWKLAGDACMLPACLGPQKFSLWVPEVLFSQGFSSQELKKICKSEAMTLAATLYSRGLSLLPEVPGLWHDLGFCYYFQAEESSDSQFATELAKKSVMCLKKAVSMQSTSPHTWNSLGVVSLSPHVRNYNLAQHCFIKSISCEPNNFVAWTNLGVLYLQNDNIQLAHEAFKVAQSLEPSYSVCWIGQALIAEKVNHPDTLDLFRHTTLLGEHPEGLLGYAHWVCTSLQDLGNRNTNFYKYNIVQMRAISTAVDALTKFTRKIHDSSSAFCMLGLVLERERLYKGACWAFKMSLLLLEEENCDEIIDKVRTNYGRLLALIGQNDEALEQFSQVKNMDLAAYCDLALTYQKLGKLKDACQAYRQALTLATVQGDQSHILVALAMVAVKIQGLESAKTPLFQSSQKKPASVQGLQALCALGLLLNDFSLSTAAMKELCPHQQDPYYGADIAFLAACVLIVQGKMKMALHHLSKFAHGHPNSASIWSHLAGHLLSFHPYKATTAARCAMSAVLTGKNVTGLPLLVIQCHMVAGNKNRSLQTAQKAVHLFPDKVEHWCSLLGILSSSTSQENFVNALFVFVRKILNGSSPALESWLLQCVKYHRLIQKRKDVTRTESLSTDSLTSTLVLDAVADALTKPRFDQSCVPTIAVALQKDPKCLFGWFSIALLQANSEKYKDSINTLQRVLKSENTVKSLSRKVVSLLHLAVIALNIQKTRNEDEWKSLVQETITEVLKIDSHNQGALFLQALVLAGKSENSRLIERCLKKVLNCADPAEPKWMEWAARRFMVAIYKRKNNSDGIERLLEGAIACGDTEFVNAHKVLEETLNNKVVD
ncbi:tetratricopeptide repeat protein 37-like [Limulus polyphemus]|uniref:Tetratricopeptide repeat protein 37-like n=1 Tax=Limulus polyphemus TaxID=6850 RepID=A0ABM1B8Q7_LIMPO|nr:tetratricopeptide repeat protein 37-like [Limulus polyphemus]